MHFCYKKLFKLLIDRGLKKKDLCKLAGISSTSVAKLGRGDNVNTEVLCKICGALNCNVCDIMEFVPVNLVEQKEVE
jgi:DNA-binding Xre family transcriptional regulator